MLTFNKFPSLMPNSVELLGKAGISAFPGGIEPALIWEPGSPSALRLEIL
jgi:hypothetical protein